MDVKIQEEIPLKTSDFRLLIIGCFMNLGDINAPTVKIMQKKGNMTDMKIIKQVTKSKTHHTAHTHGKQKARDKKTRRTENITKYLAVVLPR